MCEPRACRSSCGARPCSIAWNVPVHYRGVGNCHRRSIHTSHFARAAPVCVIAYALGRDGSGGRSGVATGLRDSP